MKRFEGKVVLVTGGTSGIGLALAEALLREGASVAVCGRDRARVQAFRARHPGALGLACGPAAVGAKGSAAPCRRNVKRLPMLATETRMFCPDLHSLLKFAPYWILIRVASGLIRRRTLRAIKAAVESEVQYPSSRLTPETRRVAFNGEPTKSTA